MAKSEVNDAEKRNIELAAINMKIRKAFLTSQLSPAQAELVEESKDELPIELLVNWRAIRFKRLLGSGSFGDCYEGVLQHPSGEELAVAVKKMRVGLVDKEGVKAFGKEVLILA